MSNTTYDRIKGTVTVISPILVTLLISVGVVFDLNLEAVAGAIAALSAAVATYLNESSKNYHRNPLNNSE